MNLPNKKFIIFYLMACVMGAFVFHWFFVDNMMPVRECLSANNDCVYSPAQTIPPQTANMLLVVLLAISLFALLSFTIWLENKLKKMPGRMFLGWETEGFFDKLISWLKILEKRDPQTALTAARIFDFSQ